MTNTPGNLPIYRVLTGPDDASFCERVSEALALGWELHGAPSVTFDGQPAAHKISKTSEFSRIL